MTVDINKILGPDGFPIRPGAQIKTESKRTEPKVEQVDASKFGPAMKMIKDVIESVQAHDDEIGAYIYPERNLVIFWKRGIILDKIHFSSEEIFTKHFVSRKTKEILRRWRTTQKLDTSILNSIKRQTQRLVLGKKL